MSQLTIHEALVHAVPMVLFVVLAVVVVAANLAYVIDHARKCEQRFNSVPRHCACGGPRKFDGIDFGECHDTCTTCGKVTLTPEDVFLNGHQCNEDTIEPSGRCKACGRMLQPMIGLKTIHNV